jgi:hypothetical protein
LKHFIYLLGSPRGPSRGPSRLEEAEEIIYQASLLEKNWNSYDADPFTEELISQCNRVLGMMDKSDYTLDRIYYTTESFVFVTCDNIEFEIYEYLPTGPNPEDVVVWIIRNTIGKHNYINLTFTELLLKLRMTK